MPVLNEERHIVTAVAAMRAQQFDGVLEFLVVDGGSTDRTLALVSELAREDPRVRVLHNPRRIASSALNVALAHARGRFVARMDAHTEYPTDYIARGVQRLAAGDSRWISGPPIASGDGPVSRAVALALSTPLGRGASRKWASEREASDREYELDSGVFAGVWERETVLEYGGWDEHWMRNQDSEMAGRFLAKGEKLICLAAMAAHYTPRGSIPSLWRQYLQYGEYRARTAGRHPHTMRRSHLIAPALVATAGAAFIAPRSLRRPARAGLGLYGVALGAAGIGAAGASEEATDAGLVPLVLAAMHFGHGVGMWRFSLRHGPPLAAIAHALGNDTLAQRLAPAQEPVYAPSLHAHARQRPPVGSR
jgi:GT2 family glycosyltransferase